LFCLHTAKVQKGGWGAALGEGMLEKGEGNKYSENRENRQIKLEATICDAF